MDLNLFDETLTSAQILGLGGTWVEVLNRNEDGVVYLPIGGPEDLILIPHSRGEEE